jgi:hypothetical protein
MITVDSLGDCRTLLVDAGLSLAGVLMSSGVTRHIERMEHGEVSRDTLVQYAADLTFLREQTNAWGAAIPVDFWDVGHGDDLAQRRKNAKSLEEAGSFSSRGSAGFSVRRTVRREAPLAEKFISRRSAEQDEYAVAHAFSQPEYLEYVRLLGRCYGHLCDFKAGRNGTAVTTALTLLRETAAYVCAGHCRDMASTCPAAKPEQQAIFLWQQIVAGTNRQVPYIHRDAYTHGAWGRFNVVAMWQFSIGAKASVDEVWGLSGFSEPFIGDATNTNQIEHMTITALAQIVLGIPAVLLVVLEEMEWMLRKGTYAASKADERVNRAVARHFRPLFRLEDPGPACEALEQALRT